MTQLSNRQIKQLGDRLREGSETEEDVRNLHAFRQSYQIVRSRVMEEVSQLDINATARLIKSEKSITEKLRRQPYLKLSQMQDIAGCRIECENIIRQDECVHAIEAHFAQFDTAKSVDRREKPSHGYRAVHIIVRMEKRPFEIQVRTNLQHLWAQWVEQLASATGQNLKYGEGDPEHLQHIYATASLVSRIERLERALHFEEESEGKSSRMEELRSIKVDTMSHLSDALKMLRTDDVEDSEP